MRDAQRRQGAEVLDGALRDDQPPAVGPLGQRHERGPAGLELVTRHICRPRVRVMGVGRTTKGIRRSRRAMATFASPM